MEGIQLYGLHPMLVKSFPYIHKTCGKGDNPSITTCTLYRIPHIDVDGVVVCRYWKTLNHSFGGLLPEWRVSTGMCYIPGLWDLSLLILLVMATLCSYFYLMQWRWSVFSKLVVATTVLMFAAHWNTASIPLLLDFPSESFDGPLPSLDSNHCIRLIDTRQNITNIPNMLLPVSFHRWFLRYLSFP